MKEPVAEMKPRSSAVAVLLCLIASLIALPNGAVAAPNPCPLGLTVSSTQDPPGGVKFVICSGRIPSFDGTPLDADLSLPVHQSKPMPLMVMLHGWGNDKTEWERSTLKGDGRDKYHWNNAWFVSQGFDVLTYSAHGFHRSCGKDPATGYSYASDPECSGHPGEASWAHLSDRRWAPHHTKYMVGLLVDVGIARPRQIVVTGGSYGGGQSWLLAMSNERVMLPDGSTVPWSSPKGIPIRLAAAIPKYTWSDLLQALTDNGRASSSPDVPDRSHAKPIGVEKKSYVDGLYGLGQATAQFAASDPTADLNSWYAGLNAGEPYEANPQVAQAIKQITRYRSPFYMPAPKLRVPVLAIQGVTDPLFPAVQALQMIARLRAVGYPVWAFLGDVGHSYAGDPSDVWHLADDEGNQWLTKVMAGQSPTLPRFTVASVRCERGQPLEVLTAQRFSDLASGQVAFSSKDSQTTQSNSPPGPEAAAVDPIANAGCRTINEQTDPGVAAWSSPAPASFLLIGSPVVITKLDLAGTNAEIAARLWDVDPTSGTQTLVTRTVYRLLANDPQSSHSLAFALWPTAWRFLAGHQMKLELTQVDAPSWRPDNLSSSITFTKVRLELPAAP